MHPYQLIAHRHRIWEVWRNRRSVCSQPPPVNLDTLTSLFGLLTKAMERSEKTFALGTLARDKEKLDRAMRK